MNLWIHFKLQCLFVCLPNVTVDSKSVKMHRCAHMVLKMRLLMRHKRKGLIGPFDCVACEA